MSSEFDASGLVAPAWPAASSSTGMPARTPSSRVWHASSANLSGGTTKQDDMLTKGFARHAASLPATACSMGRDSSRCSGSTQLLPTCLAVPEMHA